LELAMNEHEATRIAAAIHELRPDWPASSLKTLILKHLANKPRRDVTVALGWVACEANTATPARVLEAGPWWRAAGIEGTAAQRDVYDATTHCDVCSVRQDRHIAADHEFISAGQHMARRGLASNTAEHVKRLKQLAALDKPEPPEPVEHEPSPNVDRLRHLKDAATTEETE